jgi:mannose-6-phosphate isomerase-like protein (cupin superfamily)
MRAILLVAALVTAGSASASDQATFVNAKDLKWKDAALPAGAREAPLWGDPASGDHGTVVRWKFNTKVPNLVRTQEVHVVVLTGTFTAQVGGQYGEFGPGGYVRVPKGVKHSFGCEAAGECRFILHHPGPVEVTGGK